MPFSIAAGPYFCFSRSMRSASLLTDASPLLIRFVRVSINAHVCDVRDFFPFADFAAHEAPEFSRRPGCDIEPRGQERGAHIAGIHDAHDFGVEPRDERLGRSGARDHAMPRRRFET